MRRPQGHHFLWNTSAEAPIVLTYMIISWVQPPVNCLCCAPALTIFGQASMCLVMLLSLIPASCGPLLWATNNLCNTL